MSNHRKAPGDKASNGKKQKTEAKKQVKEKTVAAEIGGTVMREEAAKPVAKPAKPVARPTPRPAAPAAQAQASKTPPEPKPAVPSAPPPASEAQAGKKTPLAKPEARPAPRPAPPPASEVQASKKPPEPKPASRPEPRPAPAGAAQASKKAPASKPESRAESSSALQPGPVESAVETIERSVKAAGRGTVAVNCRLIDFAKANVNASLDHVKDLAAARNPVRMMRLQMEYWHDCLETFASQAEELRALSAELVANANEPIRQHMRRSLKGLAA